VELVEDELASLGVTGLYFFFDPFLAAVAAAFPFLVYG
jgi:ferric-dicitrate binding protein FerR (iron transport regulator)